MDLYIKKCFTDKSLISFNNFVDNLKKYFENISISSSKISDLYNINDLNDIIKMKICPYTKLKSFQINNTLSEILNKYEFLPNVDYNISDEPYFKLDAFILILKSLNNEYLIKYIYQYNNFIKLCEKKYKFIIRERKRTDRILALLEKSQLKKMKY